VKKNIPVYNIDDFKQFESGKDFYANTLAEHLATHHFIHVPHKHDFYITILFTKGSGTHEIDFLSYPVKPGSVFFLSPGQTHNWKLSKNSDGYIFFHSAEFYDLNFTSKKIKDYPFFASLYNMPLLHLKLADKKQATQLFRELLSEYKANKWMKHSKLCSLSDLIYIELARAYPPLYSKKEISPGYMDKLAKLENLVAAEFKTVKFPKAYAARMHMSEKHLNRICRECVGKTTTEIISDRIIIEAKRLLTTSDLPVSEVAEALGYLDRAYFSRLFKKKCGQTPLEFTKHYKAL
jgi:AraC family transcriptional activator of pobA